MNSLFQTLYMTPQFRDCIFQLPLDYKEAKDGADPEPCWNVGAKKHKVLREI